MLQALKARLPTQVSWLNIPTEIFSVVFLMSIFSHTFGFFFKNVCLN